ncbi:ABC transporter ATP-binding protein [Shumkonia mesophila]|uniref:ABC transporter ATP-binding protein n=1 Tax=Shumkonia mesophila TaxID=2838854 RepID=UPI002934AE9C|nr:ABC transporter ATP-binding protein [Shumkonia mesophila]
MSDSSIPEPVLVLENLHASYGDSHVLQGCSLSVGHECVTVLGRNGMGKTTLLRAIMGLTAPKSGRIVLNGEDLAGLKPFQIAAHGIGYVPQGRRLFPSLSVQEHLVLTYASTHRPNEWTPNRVFELFPELWDRRHVSGTRLSGGEQQMLAIGRALVTNPRVLLLDEPSEGLSPVANERVIETCRALQREGLAILLVEQNIRVAEALANRIYVILSGKTVYESPAQAFLEDLALRQKYLGV